MRFMIIVKGVMPRVTQYNEELARAGVLLDLASLEPSSNGKDLIAGYWLIQVKSREEALEWARRIPAPHGEGEVEVRQLVDLE